MPPVLRHSVMRSTGASELKGAECQKFDAFFQQPVFDGFYNLLILCKIKFYIVWHHF